MKEQRERLIELLDDAQCELLNEEYEHTTSKRLAEYVADRLLSEGVIVPPCKVGQKVYKVVADNRVKHPIECKVIGFWISEEVNFNNAHLARYVNGVFESSFAVPFTDFGRTVFLTKEEAEQALAEGSKR